MKRLFFVFIFFILMEGITMAGFLNHPNWNNINTFTNGIIQSIDDAQASFFVQYGRYFQGLWLLGDQQVDGTTDIVIDNATMPNDFGFSWKDLNPAIFKNNLKIPINVCVNVYQAPNGWGWILKAEAYYPGLGPDAYGHDGVHWVYRHHVGPEEFSGIFDEWYIQVEE